MQESFGITSNLWACSNLESTCNPLTPANPVCFECLDRVLNAFWLQSCRAVDQISIVHFSHHYAVFAQGLRPGVPAESPAMMFAAPTKMISEAGAVEYLGANRVPDLQRLYQVIKSCFHLSLYSFYSESAFLDWKKPLKTCWTQIKTSNYPPKQQDFLVSVIMTYCVLFLMALYSHPSVSITQKGVGEIMRDLEFRQNNPSHKWNKAQYWLQKFSN